MDQYIDFFTNPLVIGTFAIVFIFWLTVLIQTWANQDSGFIQKLLWTIGHLILWPIVTPLYAIIKYNGLAKIIPIIICIAGATVYFASANKAKDMMFYGANAFVEQRVKQPQMKAFVTERLQILEREKTMSQKATNIALATYMIHLLDDINGLTKSELKNWTQAYNNREHLSPEEIQQLITERVK